MQRLTGKLSKIPFFPQMGHKRVIKGIQARATRKWVPVNYLNPIKETHNPEGARSLARSWASRQRPHGVTAQQLASSRHISVKEIFSILRTCNFNSK